MELVLNYPSRADQLRLHKSYEKGKRILDTKNMFEVGNEQRELTDAELVSVCGGYRFHFNDMYSPASNSGSVNNSFNPGTVTQIAYATSYISSPGISLPGGANSMPTLVGSAQASNYYNYSVGNQGQ